MKILIVDAGMPFKGGNGGALNHRLTEIEKATLESLGHEVQVTRTAGKPRMRWRSTCGSTR